MKLEELTAGGPGLNGYAYRGDVYCVRCGRATIKHLFEVGDLPPTLDRCDDTERCPRPIFHGESDYPQHCANCGAYLYGLLRRFDP